MGSQLLYKAGFGDPRICTTWNLLPAPNLFFPITKSFKRRSSLNYHNAQLNKWNKLYHHEIEAFVFFSNSCRFLHVLVIFWKSSSRLQKQFFLKVCQNNFQSKIPFNNSDTQYKRVKSNLKKVKNKCIGKVFRKEFTQDGKIAGYYLDYFTPFLGSK